MKRTVILTILDGLGIAPKDISNPLSKAQLPTIEYIKTHWPIGALQASGIAVGLPWGEEGNSEVGHLTLGAGKVLYQHYPRISLAIRNKSFFHNPVLKQALNHTQKNDSALNLIGLLSQGHVHSAYEHLIALLELAYQEKISKINLHLFSDGRDSPPQSGLSLIKKLLEDIKKYNSKIRIASIAGRFYAMDRDKHWDRTERAYQVLAANSLETTSLERLEKIFEKNYAEGRSDEFITPTIVDPQALIQSGDALIFFNFRKDRIRQLLEPFTNPNFTRFERKPLENLGIVTFTPYGEEFDVPAAFPPDAVKKSLGLVLSENNKLQLRIAETEKYAHVTYFFNGLKEEPFLNEYRILVPSKNVPFYDEYPEMMAKEVTMRAVGAIEENAYDFILMNYANPDMVAHTGNFNAAIKAMETIDQQLGKLKEAVLSTNAILIITSDHGNIERMVDPLSGRIETKHDPNPVPFYFIAKEFERMKTEAQAEIEEKNVIGMLSDVAPTILELMTIKPPAEMTGKSLLEFLL